MSWLDVAVVLLGIVVFSFAKAAWAERRPPLELKIEADGEGEAHLTFSRRPGLRGTAACGGRDQAVRAAGVVTGGGEGNVDAVAGATATSAEGGAMTEDWGCCGVCGRGPTVGVASVPGAAVSIPWCAECLRRGCQPLFTIEVALLWGDAEHLEYDESVATMLARAKQVGVNPVDHLADWFLEEQTFYEGEYVGVRELLTRLYEEADGGD